MSRTDPDRIAIVAPDGSAVTFADLVAQVNRTSAGILRLRLAGGDVVAGMVRNSVEYYRTSTRDDH
jgi:long-chain acyl-CoA synthetase